MTTINLCIHDIELLIKKCEDNAKELHFNSLGVYPNEDYKSLDAAAVSNLSAAVFLKQLLEIKNLETGFSVKNLRLDYLLRRQKQLEDFLTVGYSHDSKALTTTLTKMYKEVLEIKLKIEQIKFANLIVDVPDDLIEIIKPVS